MICYSRYTFNHDDIWMWLNIYESQPIFNGYRPSDGRFFPLASLDLNLIAIFSHSPYVFFAFNALIVFSVGILLWSILELILGEKFYTLRVLLLLCILLHPGFVTIMLGICFPERLQVFFLALFVISSIKFYRYNSTSSAIIGLISANIALYYKEPTFLIIGSFALLMLLDSKNPKQRDRTLDSQQPKKVKHERVSGGEAGFTPAETILKGMDSIKHKRNSCWYYATLLLSVFVFLILYFALITPHIEKAYTRGVFFSAYEEILYILKGLFSFIITDSFLLLLLPTLLLYRIFSFVFKKDRKHIFWDSLLLGGFLYLCAFIKLHLFDTYYLIPIYFITLGAMLYFLLSLNLIKHTIFKGILILCALLICINTIPMGIYTYISLKTEGVKFHETLAFVAGKAKEKASANQILTLYFDGNGRGDENYTTWYWGYFACYLKILYGTSHFDIKTKDENPPTLWRKIHQQRYPKLSIYNDDNVTTPQSGDLIILNSSTIINANNHYTDKLAQKYHLIYTSKAFSIPYIGLKPLLKTIFKQSQTIQNAAEHNQNTFKLPLRDYIFEVY
ncbi:hypothetical protein [Helicobacter himalayensis]|uniref:hypothetical protein n=1 Tax=Helicobacter himalayensis TaxID=1591088 RepID=UPI00082EBBBB|nr:hypothetical protein [Helicobacter himalayensis]